MPELALSTLMISVQSVKKQIEYFEGLLESDTVRDKTEIQELLLTYDQTAEELKKAYISKRKDGSHFPEYKELV